MRRNLSLLLALLLLIMLLVACSATAEEAREVNEADNLDIEVEEVKEEIEEVVELPDVSQQVTEFPWDEDEDFKKAQVENQTDVLIAGFVTVSEDYKPDELDNISLAVSMINGTVVNPGEVFSQNETAGPYTEEKGYKEGDGYVGGKIVKDFGGGVCNVATTLYNTSIVSNLEVVERYNHSMPVEYVPYGQDAAVAYGHKDFQFKNNTEDPILIWAAFIDSRLFMGFYGKEAAPEVKWEHETLSEVETTTQYIINPDLDEDEENVLVKGMDGKVVDSIVRIKDENGEETVRDLGRSVYNPMNFLIEKSE